MSERRRRFRVVDAGVMPYGDALLEQERLVAARREGSIPDTLLVLQHPPVITLGSGSDPENILLTEEERIEAGIERFEVGRGGDVTLHAPGQMVVYPVLDLKPDRKDLHAYLRDLEEVLIRVAADFGLEAERSEGATGVWTEGGKVAAIGVRVSSGWITSHGLALNVHTDLGLFDTIVPCGITDRPVTSLERELGVAPAWDEVRKSVVRHFASVFDAEIVVV